jgi:glycosyltransferase involved in cell wall biosynthesis
VPAPQVRDYQVAADVLLAPYGQELTWAGYTSPLKIFEYLAAGRPIVASHLPVLSEVLSHGVDAWLVELASADALAAGVRRVLSTPRLAADLARGAREAAPAHTWEARAGAILARFAEGDRGDAVAEAS